MKSVLITGGLGDAITVESFFPDSLRATLGRVYYATRAASAVIDLFKAIPRYRSVEHVVLWEDWSSLWCFFRKDEVAEVLKALPEAWDEVEDWSISTAFPRLGPAKYNGSSVLSIDVDVSRFNLPTGYVVVVPASVNDFSNRALDPQDWHRLFQFLEESGRVGVVLYEGAGEFPPHPRLIDLSNRTTVAEAVTIVRGAAGYYGIDSALSVVAAKVLVPDVLRVKSRNPHLYDAAHLYYAPQTDLSFVRGKLEFCKNPSRRLGKGWDCC